MKDAIKRRNAYCVPVAAELYALMRKYRPETRAEKKKRLYDQAKKEAAGKSADSGEKPKVLKFGLKHVTHLVEEKKVRSSLLNYSDLSALAFVRGGTHKLPCVLGLDF